MLPPTLKNSVGTAAGTEELSSTCVSASLGNGTMNRLPVKRRLFADESPENSPPDLSLSVKVAELYASEKERALKWGFDVTTESPSTSSDWQYTVLKASDVPKFYTQIRGTNSIATFSPKPKDRFKEYLLPISIPPTFLKSGSVGIPSMVPETASEEIMGSAPTTSSANTVIFGAPAKNETPPKPRGPKKVKKAVSSDALISGQSLLTRYFPKKRSATIDSTAAEKRKRASTEARGASQGETSLRP